MCDGGGRPKKAVKLGATGGEGSPGRVVNIERSRLRVDHLGQFYVLDSEDEGTYTEAGFTSLIRRGKMETAMVVAVDSSVDMPACLEEATLLVATTVHMRWWHLLAARWPRR